MEKAPRASDSFAKSCSVGPVPRIHAADPFVPSSSASKAGLFELRSGHLGFSICRQSSRPVDILADRQSYFVTTTPNRSLEGPHPTRHNHRNRRHGKSVDDTLSRHYRLSAIIRGDLYRSAVLAPRWSSPHLFSDVAFAIVPPAPRRPTRVPIESPGS